eukprot:3389153-Rhodomonas_salina.1
MPPSPSSSSSSASARTSRPRNSPPSSSALSVCVSFSSSLRCLSICSITAFNCVLTEGPSSSSSFPSSPPPTPPGPAPLRLKRTDRARSTEAYASGASSEEEQPSRRGECVDGASRAESAVLNSPLLLSACACCASFALGLLRMRLGRWRERARECRSGDVRGKEWTHSWDSRLLSQFRADYSRHTAEKTWRRPFRGSQSSHSKPGSSRSKSRRVSAWRKRCKTGEMLPSAVRSIHLCSGSISFFLCCRDQLTHDPVKRLS